MSRKAIAATVMGIVFVGIAFGEPIRFIAWNLQSGGSDIDTIADQLRELGSYDVWGLTEVDDDAFVQFERALDSTGDHDVLHTAAGGDDRIILAFRKERLRKMESGEITEISLVSFRPALWARFEDMQTGTRFVVVVVHLARGGDGEEFSRYAQSRALRIWASKRTRSPVIMIGDFNYDWNTETNAQDRGYGLLVEGDLRWIRPDEIVPSFDGYPSVLDFVFANEIARQHQWSSRIIVRPGDFPDSNLTSDHRPIEATWAIE